MDDHDIFKDFAKQKEIIEKLSPKFNDLTLDIQEIFQHSDNPLFVSVLLFKLAEERNKTNKILEEINDKYDKLMFEIKTREIRRNEKEEKQKSFEVLSEIDQKILSIIEQKGSVTADIIRKEFGYKRQNAASQRLNKLFREGHLKKVKSGKKVLYIPNP
jgi:uncharacterized membrane protein